MYQLLNKIIVQNQEQFKFNHFKMEKLQIYMELLEIHQLTLACIDYPK